MIDDPFGSMEDAEFDVIREKVWKWYCGNAPASRPAPKRIYMPTAAPNDILVLSTSRYGRSFSRDQAVIWRMSVETSS